MDAEVIKNEEGQSVLEFLLVLPLLVGLTVIMVRVNTAIQVSIVDQQYARAHTLWLAFDSPVYPNLSMRQRFFQNDTYQFNQMVIGVSDNQPPSPGSDNGGGRYNPEATTQNVTRQAHPDPGPPGEDVSLRAIVRVRDTVTLCTQSNVISGSNGLQNIAPLQGQADPIVAAGNNALTDNARQFAFCASPVAYP